MRLRQSAAGPRELDALPATRLEVDPVLRVLADQVTAARLCFCGAELSTDGAFCRGCDLPALFCDCRGRTPEPAAIVEIPPAQLHVVPGAGQLVVPPPTNPMGVGRAFVAERYTGPDAVLRLRHHRGDFYGWDSTSWPELEERTVRASLYTWLEDAVYEKEGSSGVVKLVRFDPNRRKLGDVVDAIQAVGHLPARFAAPGWLDGDDQGIAASDVVSMANGILHLPSRTIIPHTPRLFVHHSLPFDYDPDAAAPSRWHRFIDELWDDADSRDVLAEIMGYVLAGGTEQQKMFLVVGPKRSGKGTIGRVLTGLLGPHNTTAPTLASLTSNFGLADLIDKPLAVVSDARLGGRTDGLIAVERLLSISGEDSITVDRKYKPAWTGRLPTRFVILTNEIPRFTDSSGALASRFILLATAQSFYGREDPGLTDALLAEAPGIFNWALKGFDRLTERGYFAQPASSDEAIRQLEDLASPVGAFVRDRCLVGAGHEVDKDDLFDAWKTWCEAQGRDRPGTKSVFARDLRAAVPGVHDVRPRGDGDRVRVFVGLRLYKQWEGPWTTLDQVDVEASRSGVADEEHPRSEGVVQGGPGSSALWATPEDVEPSKAPRKFLFAASDDEVKP